MGEITDFPTKKEEKEEKEPRVWVCTCGCSTFELLETGETRCGLCATISDHSGGWYSYPSEAEWTEDSPMQDIQGNGSVEFVRELMKRRIDEDAAVVVLVLEKNGRMHAWTAAENPEQHAWSLKELESATGILDTIAKEKF